MAGKALGAVAESIRGVSSATPAVFMRAAYTCDGSSHARHNVSPAAVILGLKELRKKGQTQYDPHSGRETEGQFESIVRFELTLAP